MQEEEKKKYQPYKIQSRQSSLCQFDVGKPISEIHLM